MKILLPIKQVIDPDIKVQVNPDGDDVVRSGVKLAINPYDEIAVEQAVRLQEKGIIKETVVVSCGPDNIDKTIKHALAMGVDRGIHVLIDDELSSLGIAQLLKAICLQEKPDLVLCGRQSVDHDSDQVGQMLAALLGWPQAIYAVDLTVEKDRVVVQREVDEGLETITFALPGVVTAELRLSEPRYVTLPDIIKAKRKPLDRIKPDSLDVGSIVSPLRTLSLSHRKPRNKGMIVESVNELIDKLKTEKKVIGDR
ncbi:electron transfer flavoprotein subunit beta/FixA family protein [Magnetococcales bacterium HHB-1]